MKPLYLIQFPSNVNLLQGGRQTWEAPQFWVQLVLTYHAGEPWNKAGALKGTYVSDFQALEIYDREWEEKIPGTSEPCK